MKPRPLVLIGSNIAHSRSPDFHNRHFRELGLPWSYGLLELVPDQLPEAIAMMKREGYIGANVTSPYKEEILPLLDRLSPEAERIGAVNTLLFRDRDDGGRESVGFNTDIVGFRESIAKHPLLLSPFTASVLGTGGAARAAVDSLLSYPALRSLTIYSRSESGARRAGEFWQDNRLFCQRLNQFQPTDLVVHATPVGLPGNPGPLLEAGQLRGVHLLYDMIYFPLPTRLMEEGVAAGAEVMGGSTMFDAQATAALEIWRMNAAV